VSTAPTIGFDRRIKLEWLERAAALVLLGGTARDVRDNLHDILRDEVQPHTNAGKEGREKSVRLIMHIWVSPRDELRSLRCGALEHFSRLPSAEHLPLHWGMTIAAYPFFGTVAEAVGRLLRLQGSAGAAQVQRRMREQFGDRQFVERPTRHILRTLIEWDVLKESGDKGVYQPGLLHPIDDVKLKVWLVEATLLSNGSRPVPLRAVSNAPALFPFAVGPITPGTVAGNERLDVFRQGVDEDMVSLRVRPRDE